MRRRIPNSTIYMLTFADGRRYIGSTRMRLADRLIGHANPKNPHLPAQLWQELGPPKVETLWEGAYKERLAMETMFIIKFQTMWPHGLNKVLPKPWL
jgi:hypothetical protein